MIPEKADFWAKDLVENIRRNFRLQGVFPFVDRGLWYGNKRGFGGHQWRSTGAAFDNLHATVVAASQNKAQIDLVYMYYLDFVDLGVGYNVKKEDVFRSKPYHHDQRYAEVFSWNKPANTQRPVAKIEIYNTQQRMMAYMRRYYTDIAPAYILHAMGAEIEE